MILFCLLWMPVFYVFWLTIRPENSDSGTLWALITGAAAAAARFFVPVLADAGGFGLFRYISAYVDYTSLPVLLPLAVALLVSHFCPGAGITDFTGFTLLAMVPVAFVCSIPWGARQDMLRLVLTPLLWTSLAAAFYTLQAVSGRIQAGGLPHKKIAVFGTLMFSLLPPLVWRSFFCNKNMIGALLLLPVLAPALIVCTLLFRKKQLAGQGSL
ncbi:MAG: hypothetical protein LBJ86_01760 [Spirochaetaceae bacterium]|jgi:hypothetical protein|nr:hypothetical protein [Spirochaetaceae bacterium]